ncbi:hypothetical protein IU450_14545 [Nocardia abscessus]|uniref:hypothetical protein n=1 Tax=Nocardia abscessus TaxID=120957 RepID=UPI001892F9D4|nr:hypothetical protein [Nocardia abscessus]MBF6337100.1 hypothetical protein [Nocardia abscessus]
MPGDATHLPDDHDHRHGDVRPLHDDHHRHDHHQHDDHDHPSDHDRARYDHFGATPTAASLT